MSDVYVSVHVGEDVALDDHVSTGGESGPRGWLYVGGHDVALWGSPAGLRRLAAGLVLVAERTDELRVLRYAVTGDADRARDASELPGVRGS